MSTGLDVIRLAPRSQRENMLGGGWEGPFPLGQSEPAPPPRTSVIYFLYDDQPGDEVSISAVYIGTTIHLRDRLKQHAAAGKVFGRWIAAYFPVEDAYHSESELISEFKPRLNVKGVQR